MEAGETSTVEIEGKDETGRGGVGRGSLRLDVAGKRVEGGRRL